MLQRTWAAGAFALCAISVGLWATSPTPASAQATASTAIDAAPATHVVVPWGTGNGEVGLRRPQHEAPADGASAVAVASDGSMLLLDRLNHRVVKLDRQGRHRGPWTVAQVPADVEELTVAADGALGVYSPLRARVWIYEGGQLTGEVPVPRGLRELLTVELGASRNVIARSAHQEMYRLGPPSAPQTLASVLHSKREGAFELADGSGIAARLDAKNRPEMLVLDVSGERTRVARRHPLGSVPVLSARIVGVEHGIACVRLEHRINGATFRVRRSVTFLNASSGEIVLERDLGAVAGPYVPRRSFAMGGDPTRLVFMQPADDGLHVMAWDVPRAAQGGGR
jgi:hypothetical protein